MIDVVAGVAVGVDDDGSLVILSKDWDGWIIKRVVAYTTTTCNSLNHFGVKII